MYLVREDCEERITVVLKQLFYPGCYKHKTNAQHTIWPELPVLLSFWFFYKHALHGWSISTLLPTYLILGCGPYQLIALLPCLPNFLSLSILQGYLTQLF